MPWPAPSGDYIVHIAVGMHRAARLVSDVPQHEDNMRAVNAGSRSCSLWPQVPQPHRSCCTCAAMLCLPASWWALPSSPRLPAQHLLHSGSMDSAMLARWRSAARALLQLRPHQQLRSPQLQSKCQKGKNPALHINSSHQDTSMMVAMKTQGPTHCKEPAQAMPHGSG